MKISCTNPHCNSQNFKKDGTFKRKNDHRIVQRYQCKICGKKFSKASFSLCKNQKKRTVNHLIFKLLCSGMSMRRIAKTTRVDKKTVQRKVEYLSKVAKLKHQSFLEKRRHIIAQVQFDDLVTIEHTKLKPVSMSIAVDSQTRAILGAQCSQIPAFGHLARLSRKKYGKRKNEHHLGLSKLFEKIHGTFSSDVSFRSDQHRLYPSFVQTYAPTSDHLRFKGGRGCVVGQGELKKLYRDPLFYINHTCAMLRDNLKRLSRKTWCTTKKIEMLQMHVDIYLWYHNSHLLKLY